MGWINRLKEERLYYNPYSKQNNRDQIDEQDLVRLVKKYPEKAMLYLTGEQMAAELRQRGYEVVSPIEWMNIVRTTEVHKV